MYLREAVKALCDADGDDDENDKDLDLEVADDDWK